MRNLLFRTILAIVLMFGITAMFADTIQVGTGTTTNTVLPIYSNYGYTYSQQIYTQAQIAHAGDIQKLRFWWASGVLTNNKDWVIYMGHTTKTTFSSTTDWVPLASMTQVFNGVVTAPAVPGWMEITLSTPFTYNNTDNLVIAVDENTSGYATSSWGSFTSGSNTGIYYDSDSTNPDPAAPPTASSRVSNLPRIQLAFPNSTVPLAATTPTPTDAATGIYLPTLTWVNTIGGGDPTSYDIYFGTSATPPFVQNQAGMTYTPTGLGWNTTYYWQVVPTNSFGGATACPIWSFTTVVDQTITSFPYTQSFDATTFPPIAWTNAIVSGPNTTLWARSTSQIHSGSACAYFYPSTSTASEVMLATPPVNLPSDNYRVTFWQYRTSTTSWPNSKVSVWYNTAANLTGAVQVGPAVAYSAAGTPNEMSTSGWYKYYCNLPAGSGGNGRYIILKAATTETPSFYVDDLTIEEATTPAPAIVTAPSIYPLFIDGLTTGQMITWTANTQGPAPTGYKVYFGTANPPTTFTDNGVSTSYNCGTLVANNTYYYKILPYNAVGDATYGQLGTFKTAVALTANVIGQVPATGASNVSNIGVLAWSTLTNATSYDVYFGTDSGAATLMANVVPITGASTVNWNPGELAYSTIYYWKVIAKNAAGASTGTPVVYNYTTWADQTVDLSSASVVQNFDAASTLPVGWTTFKVDATTASFSSWATSTTYAHSTTRSMGFNSSTGVLGTQAVLIAPRVNVPTDPSRVKFWIYRSTYGSNPNLSDEKIEVYESANPNLTGATLLTSIPRELAFAPTVATAGWYQYTATLPVSGVGKYIIFKGISQYGAYQYVDDVTIEKIPQTPEAAGIGAPANAATGIGPTQVLSWTAPIIGAAPTGYKVLFGTVNPPVTQVYDGTALSYDPGILTVGTTYYWKVLPYNGVGDCTSAVVWSFSTLPAVTGIASINSPANNGTDIMINASLNWYSVSNAASYDVYFGTAMPETPNANVTALTWTPPTMSYSTIYTWKIVPRNAFGSTSGTPSVWTFTTGPNPVVSSFPYTEGFDATTFPPYAWALVGTSTYNWTRVTSGTSPSVTPHNGSTAMAYRYTYYASDKQGLSTRPIAIPGNDYRVSFWMYRDNMSTNYVDEGITTYCGTSPTDTTSATKIGFINRDYQQYPVEAAFGWYKYTYNLGASGTKYVIFQSCGDAGYNMYIDDVTVEQIPQTPEAASTPYPANSATLIGPSPVFTWARGPIGAEPTGYKFSLGTTAAANELVDAHPNGTATTYTYGSALTAGTVYYWKVVPYNAAGDCSAPITWTFTTAPAVTAIATTPSPADAANPVMINAQLSWASVTNASAYDVYFGTTLPGAPNATVTTTTYNPGTMTYNTTYTWKIVPKNDFGLTSGTPSVWTFTVGPNPTVTTFPLNESFDGTTFAPYGWTNLKLAGTTNPGLWDRSTSGSSPTCSPHTGAGMTYYNSNGISAGGMAVLSTPPMNIPGNDYRVTFWVYRELSSYYNTAKYADEGVGVWYGTSPSDTTQCTQLTFIPRDGVFAPTVATSGWYQYIVPFGASTAGNGKYLVFKAKSQFGHSLYLDDVSVQQIPTAPLPAIIGSPANNAAGVALAATLSWTADPAGPAPTGYKVYYGTDNPPLTMTDLGLVTTWTPSPALAQDGHYYWQIVPYNALGDAVGAPVWNFYTVGRPIAATTPSPADGATNVGRNATLTWATVSTATSYDVYFGTTLPGTATTNVTTTSYTPAAMAATTGYQWKVVPKNTYGDALSCPTWSFTTGTGFVYAASYPTSTADDDIGQFIFADITNPSVLPDTLNSSTSINTYTDYTSITAHVLQDHIYPTTVHQINHYGFYTCWAKVFIDLNQNGTFDTEEQVFSGQTASTNMKVTANITIPSDATPGTTRLRVVLMEGGSESATLATGTYGYGETEDYTVDVTAWTAPTPPNPATVVYPTDLGTGIGLMPTLRWASGGGGAIGYYLSLGTDNPPTSIQYEKDLGLVTSWTPEVADLAYNTRYYWQIIPYNANGNASSCPVWQFDTMPDPTITSFPWNEGFDDTTFPPTGWTNYGVLKSNGSVTTDAMWNRVTSGTYSATAGAVKATWNHASTAWACLQTPPINLPADHGLSFYWKDADSKVASHDSTFCEISTDGGAHWTLLATLSAASSQSSYTQVQINLNAYAGSGRLIRWRDGTDGTYSAYGTFVDAIKIENIGNPPLAATTPTPADNANDVGITPTLSWVNGGGIPSLYNVYLDQNADPTTLIGSPTGTTLTVTTPLAYSTTYHWKVVAHNAYGDATGTSIWTFATQADPTISSFPYTENFDAVTTPALPVGWTSETYSAPSINWVTSGADPNSSPNSARIGYDYSNPLDDWLFSAPVQMVAGGFYTVTFMYDTSGSYPENLAVAVGTTQTATGMTNVLWAGEAIENDVYMSQTVSYIAPADGNYYFGWHAYSDENMYYICVDDIVFNHPTEPALSVDKTSMILPVTPIGGGSSDAVTISNIGVGTLTGTISYSAGLSGETSFAIDNLTPFVFDVTYEPTVQGLFTGTVTINTSYGSATVNVTSNAGIDVADFEANFPPWFMWDNDTNTTLGWGWYRGLPHTGVFAAGVDTHDQDVTADEWLITSWYHITAGDKLSFYWRTTGNETEYPEQMKVLMSTTGNTPTDFSTVLLDTGLIVQFAYTGVEIDLTPYIGQTACFAFNCVSPDGGWYLMVDDIGMPGLANVTVPTNLAAVPDPTGVILTWNAVPNATSYRIYTSTDPYAAPELWTLLTEEYTNSYLDAVPNPMLFYKVTAVNGTKAMNNAHAFKAQKPVTAKILKTAPETGRKK
ncbi:MAG TPA: choice-of-anchor J domain-containing protein [Candidatus Cloacimonadota bacterium]|nr:choice-of-anchor J domain-containing protein [Candidatus Cloacimonadota bacterium]